MFTLLVKSSPFSSQGSWTAYRFAKNACELSYSIQAIFFIAEGIFNAQPSSDMTETFHLHTAWKNLAKTFSFPLYVCTNGSEKRGIVLENAFPPEGFEKGSLKNLAVLLEKKTKLITFED